MPHAIGVLDEKHYLMRCPGQEGSLYINYKGLHLMVLPVLVDADYKFIWYDIIAAGSRLIGQILQ